MIIITMYRDLYYREKTSCFLFQLENVGFSGRFLIETQNG